MSLFPDIEYSIVRSDSVTEVDLEEFEDSVNKIDSETVDPLETFEAGDLNNGASCSARMSDSQVNSCKLTVYYWILTFLI